MGVLKKTCIDSKVALLVQPKMSVHHTVDDPPPHEWPAQNKEIHLKDQAMRVVLKNARCEELVKFCLSSKVGRQLCLEEKVLERCKKNFMNEKNIEVSKFSSIFRSGTQVTVQNTHNLEKDLNVALFLVDALKAERLNVRHAFSHADGDVVRRLCQALRLNSTLLELHLSYSVIGPHGARYISGYLMKNVTLLNLDLGYNGIGDDGAGYIAEALKSNTTLLELNLECNEIGDDGAGHISEALKSNTTLLELNLKKNIIDNDGAGYIAEALKKNTKLNELDLSDNTIESEHVNTLSEALTKNPKLVVWKSAAGLEGRFIVYRS